MIITLSILLDDDVSPKELQLIKDLIQEQVKDNDSGAVLQADWVMSEESK